MPWSATRRGSSPPRIRGGRADLGQWRGDPANDRPDRPQPGFGRIIGQGVRRMAEYFGQGSDRFAYHVKGLEISTVDPRAYAGWALGYAVSARGADHMRSYASWEFGDIPEETREEAGLPETLTDRFSVEGKGRGVAYSENIRSIADCLEMCKTVTRQKLGLTKNQVAILTAVTGRSWTKEELFRIGERKVEPRAALQPPGGAQARRRHPSLAGAERAASRRRERRARGESRTDAQGILRGP